MRTSKVVRDVTFLVFGGLLIFGIVTLVNRFNESMRDRSVNNSQARVRADASEKRRDWRAAVEHNRALIKNDPYNSHAYFHLATAQFNVAAAQFNLISNQDTSQEEQQEQRRQAFEDIANDAIDSFKDCLTFAQYRNEARFRLALLHMYIGSDDEIVLQYLEEAVTDGYFNINEGFSFFNKYIDLARYRRLIEQESRNRQPSYPVLPESFRSN